MEERKKMIKIQGEKPHRYVNVRFKEFNRQAYVNEYALVTGDSFEIGGAYSLHKTKRDAKSYISDDWWRETLIAVPVFVSKKTLEAITKSEDKCIFRGWEN